MSDVRVLRRATSGSITATLADYPPGLRMTTHAHADIAITLVISGRVDEAVRGRAHGALSWSVGVKPFGVEHADRFGETGARLVCLSIADPLRVDGPEGRDALATWRWVTAGPVAPLLAGLAASLMEDRCVGPWLDGLAMDVVGAMSADRRGRVRGSPPAWLHRVRSQCLEDAVRGVDTAGLAVDAGVHPVTLARLFRQAFGESISDCVRRARVQRATARLGDTTAPLVDVAAECGYADQSHLTRLLGREAGLTPRTLRRLACCDRSRSPATQPGTLRR